MFIPNTAVTVLRRVRYAEGRVDGLRIIDNRSVEVVTSDLHCWLADTLEQDPMADGRDLLQIRAQVEALAYATPAWVPRVADVLYVPETGQMFEVRHIMHTAMLSGFTPVHMTLTTTSVDYSEEDTVPVTDIDGIEIPIDLVFRVWGDVFAEVFG